MKTEPTLEGTFITTGNGPARPIVCEESTRHLSRKGWLDQAALQQREVWSKRYSCCPECLAPEGQCDHI